MDRFTIAHFIVVFIQIYTFCVIAWALTGWFEIRQGWYYSVRRFLDSVVLPYINLFRRVIPGINLGGMYLDLSPILAILVLQFFGNALANIVAYGTL